MLSVRRSGSWLYARARPPIALLAFLATPSIRAGYHPAVVGAWCSVINWPFNPVGCHSLTGASSPGPAPIGTAWPSADQISGTWDPATGPRRAFYPVKLSARNGDAEAGGGSSTGRNQSIALGQPVSTSIPTSGHPGEHATGAAVTRRPGLGEVASHRDGHCERRQAPEVLSPTTVDHPQLPRFPLLRACTTSDDPQRWWLFRLSPSGEVFHFWSTDESHYIDASSPGSVRDANLVTDFTDYSQGPSVYYDQGKLLVTGSMQGSWNASSSTRAFTVDLNGAAPEIQQTSPMLFAAELPQPRRPATGDVLVIGATLRPWLRDSGPSTRPRSGRRHRLVEPDGLDVGPTQLPLDLPLLPTDACSPQAAATEQRTCSCKPPPTDRSTRRRTCSCQRHAASRPQIFLRTGDDVLPGDTFDVDIRRPSSTSVAIRMSAVTHQ